MLFSCPYIHIYMCVWRLLLLQHCSGHFSSIACTLLIPKCYTQPLLSKISLPTVWVQPALLLRSVFFLCLVFRYFLFGWLWLELTECPSSLCVTWLSYHSLLLCHNLFIFHSLTLRCFCNCFQVLNKETLPWSYTEWITNLAVHFRAALIVNQVGLNPLPVWGFCLFDVGEAFWDNTQILL